MCTFKLQAYSKLNPCSSLLCCSCCSLCLHTLHLHFVKLYTSGRRITTRSFQSGIPAQQAHPHLLQTQKTSVVRVRGRPDIFNIQAGLHAGRLAGFATSCSKQSSSDKPLAAQANPHGAFRAPTANHPHASLLSISWVDVGQF